MMRLGLQSLGGRSPMTDEATKTSCGRLLILAGNKREHQKSAVPSYGRSITHGAREPASPGP